MLVMGLMGRCAVRSFGWGHRLPPRYIISMAQMFPPIRSVKMVPRGGLLFALRGSDSIP